ncbi:MAG: hypothetical protein J7621_12120 [Niastella sp.]|nr:hypothetical protein [Niastella sp.]
MKPSSCLLLLLLLTATFSSSGQKDNSGLLIPRIDLARGLTKLPANTLMVFNTNDKYANGKGIYLNMGTASRPHWQAMVPVPLDTNMFIRNQTTEQPNSDFNVSGSGTVGGTLKVNSIVQALSVHITSTNFEPLIIRTNNAFGTGIRLSNTHQALPDPLYWSLKHESGVSATPDAFTISNSSSIGTKLVTILPNGNMGIRHVLNPAEALEVNGNVKVAGSFLIDLEYVKQEVSLGGKEYSSYLLTCPAGKKVIGGGGGHRDYNSAIKDIHIAYSGPDFYDDPNRWLLYIYNSSGSKRALVLYCACAKVQ